MNAEQPSSTQVVLGTAQWGMPYGIANRGRPSIREVRSIMKVARDGGVRTLDTARAYGESENVIGMLTARDRHWQIITKLTPELTDDEGAIVAETRASLHQSRQALARTHLDTLLLHRPDHLTRGNGAAWRHLLRQRENRMIGRLGVSVVTAGQAVGLLDDPEIQALQVPFSLLDQRLKKADFFEQARLRGKEVFVRSVFLQGLAFLPHDELDPYFELLKPVLRRLDGWAKDNHMSRTALFLGYAQTQRAHVVLGCESAGQLRQNLAIWKRGSLAPAQEAEVEALVPELPEALLDPAQWQLG